MAIEAWVAHEADCDRCDRPFDAGKGRLTYPNLKELLDALREAGWVCDVNPGLLNRVKCRDCVDLGKEKRMKGALTAS